jgi:hypothetical protein
MIAVVVTRTKSVISRARLLLSFIGSPGGTPGQPVG